MYQHGQLRLIGTYQFSKRAARMSPAFSGEADLYEFAPVFDKTKVRYIAVVRGVAHEVMCNASGDVGSTILGAADMSHRAKNCPNPSAALDSYPEPVGCPMDRLYNERTGPQVLLFYPK